MKKSLSLSSDDEVIEMIDAQFEAANLTPVNGASVLD
mgnify:FL=1